MAALLYAIFFVSGVSALIFETLWFRQAGLAFGNSIWASSLVLSGFMGGLALGNALVARHGNRFRNPLRVYAAAEFAIALTGIGLVYLLPVLGVALAPWFRPLLDQPWMLNSLRLLIAFLLLLIPSTAMGVTLPLFTKILKVYDSNFGSVLGKLYGWNTLGAAIGAIAGETYLIGAYGVHGTALIAGTLNLGAAVTAGWVSTHSQLSPTHPAPSQSRANKDSQAGRLWLSAAFLSGFCLLALEVVWFRFLLLFVMGHSVAFALMLAVILAGIALGGLVGSYWLRLSSDAYRFVSPIAISSAILCVFSYAIFPMVIKPFASYQIRYALDILRVAMPLMFPVSLLSGIFFTLTGAALGGTLASETKTTGRLTVANTTGAALGSLFGGFVLLPVLGMEKSFFLIAVLYGGLGALFLLRGPTQRRIAVASAAAFLLSILFFPFGSMVRFVQIPIKRHLQTDTNLRHLPVREGLTETIMYLQTSMLGRPLSYRLLTNSFSMSENSHAPRRYMKLFVYWPIAVHPSLKHVLLIGYGIGNTAKAATDSKSPETIDVVDISRDLLEMSNIVYPDKAEQPLQDNRVRVHIEDGRYFLETTDRRFDLITGEPPPAGLASAVNLYTREYFQLLFDRLAEGGIVTYRMPLHELTDVSVKALLRAFCDVFRDCSLWNGMDSILMLVGTRNAQGPVQEDQFIRQWNDPVVGPEMGRLGFERPEQLGALFIGDTEYLKEIVGNSPPLLDNYPKLIEAPASSAEEVDRLYRSFTDVDAARERFTRSPLIKRLWPERLKIASLPYFKFQDIINRHFYRTKLRQLPTLETVHTLLTQSSLSTPILWYLDGDSDIQRVVADAGSEELARPDMQFHLGIRFISERNYAAAVEPLRLAEQLPQLHEYAFWLHQYALCMSKETDKARCLRQPR